MAEPTPADADAIDEDWKPRRSPWPAIFALLVVGGAGAAAWVFLNAEHIVANRVLIAVATEGLEGARGAWWGSRGQASARLADELAEQLETLGMEPVPAGDPKTLAAVEGLASDADLQAAARKLGAAWIIGGQLKVTREVPLGETGKREYLIEARLVVSGTAPGEAAVPAGDGPERLFAMGEDEEQALLDLAEPAARRVTTGLATVLGKAPALARLDGAEGLANEELVIAGKLGPLFRLMRKQEEEMARRAGEEAEGAKAEQKARLDPKHRLGGYLAEEYVVGRAAGGRLLLMDESQRVRVYPGETVYKVDEGHDRLVLCDPDGGAREVLLEAYNLFSFPSISADGRWVAAVLDHRGWAKALVAIAVDGGEMTTVLEHASDYYSSPEIAPDGSLIAFWFRTCRRCDSDLRVVGRDGKGLKTLLAADAWDGSVSQPVWSPDGKTLYVTLDPRDDEGGSVWAFDVTTGKRKALLGPAAEGPAAEGAAEGEEGEAAVPPEFDGVVIAPDGSFLALRERDVERDQRHLGVYDLKTGKYRRVQQGWARRLAVSPDGTRVAAETKGTRDKDDPDGWDVEIVSVDLADGKTKYLTFNSVDDRLAGWSADGARVYFHQGSRDPDKDHWNNRIYWAAP